MYYIEDDNFLSLEQKNYINNEILGDRFPLFLNKDDVGNGNGNNWLSHTILERKEIRVNNRLDNPYADFFMGMLTTFAKKHDIPDGELLRCCVNFNFSDKFSKSDIHNDHNFSHNQLIIYLNQPQDTRSTTIILDDDRKTVLKEIEPKQFRGICFENKPHYHHYPRVGYRAVCVYTFR